jgi:hypothetical protein
MLATVVRPRDETGSALSRAGSFQFLDLPAIRLQPALLQHGLSFFTVLPC